MKYYAIRRGRRRGVYTDWNKVETLVRGHNGAEYKSFRTEEEAQRWLSGKKDTVLQTEQSKCELIAYTDGSYNEHLGYAGYGVVLLNRKGNVIKTFYGVVETDTWQVAGELEAVKKAVRFAIKNNHRSIEIRYDYKGVEEWATGRWNANKETTQKYVNFINTAKKRLNIDFVKVEAHTGNYYNEQADTLAKTALKNYAYIENKI